MSASPRTSYDEVPYDSYPFPQTHPDRLATIATLLGLQPAPVEHCRALELGCAAGGNLIPMALTLPDSTFLGIDLSARQIDDGRQTVAALGLTNIELRQLSILDVDASFGRFDYLICHGVFSWVPAAVQEKILAICAAHLAPHGVAYISYNTYPGWHLRGMIRDMMLYHAQQFREPAVRVRQARNLLDFLA
jgi:SAM-dependent methyltransferase